MKAELILKSDVLDIVFDNRNKDYGAYDLRKFYDNRLMKSLGVMIAVVIVLSAFTFIPKKENVTRADGYIPAYGYVIPEPKEKIKPAEKPKELQQPKQKAPMQTWTTPVIAKPLEPVKTLSNLSDSVVISNITQSGEPGNRPVILTPVAGDGGGKGPGTELAKPVVDINTPTDNPDIMPS